MNCKEGCDKHGVKLSRQFYVNCRNPTEDLLRGHFIPFVTIPLTVQFHLGT